MSPGPRARLCIENVDGVVVVSFTDTKGKLKLCCIHPDLLVPFKLTWLHKVFEIHAEGQAALNKY
ncbi:MAG TPA: hypothetical protein VKF17_10915 [Isosphaeraceae bacterium]|nr:hypothetical protein [Isosphaeraceae bacterium]